MIESFGLYLVITDPIAGYDACTKAAVDCGLRYVQLRMKDSDRNEIIRVGKRMRAITRDTATRFILNDDVDAASEVDADGVHLGQTDMPLDEARRRWPASRHKIFGISTHDEHQAQEAMRRSPDYIGVGPVFTTPTKQVPDPVLGVERCAGVIRAAKVTSVAIGGLNPTRLSRLLAAGVRNFAVVRYVCRHPRPIEPIRELMRLWREYC